MNQNRLNALKSFSKHEALRLCEEKVPVSSFFGQKVFDLIKMRNYVTRETFDALIQSIEEGKQLDKSISNQIAEGMKTWAVSLGATHYTHWFHPLNGSTAEKHEAFVESAGHGAVIERFKGDALVQQEPDASSFPSGGLRNTFEARGYTAWDPTSPAFIVDQTLCIPTVFVSYTGDSLDLKTPLLRSLDALDKAATAVARYFDPGVKKVDVTLGIEQEYFLVDLALYRARPDLMLCGRTLQGHTAAKDQQLEDHYFGNIPSRVMAYMKDFETEAYKLGVVLKTRHNEVAPSQYEFAPLFTLANLANDQNQMMMLLMRKLAKKHHFKVVFHEKPFAGVNGSGKHCNWSLVANGKTNLLAPGKTPQNNLQFLTFCACILRAVHRHHHLLMASIASLNNSIRLGGSEAPPSVLSVFMGQTLDRLFTSIEQDRFELHQDREKSKAEALKIVSSLPQILPDNTDRNRTSPFAFTGNRFEFRAVGSSANCATALIPLNAAVAEQLELFKEAVDGHLAQGQDTESAILHVVRQFVKDASPIRFEGNGYSQAWQTEAARRGLRGIERVTDAFKAYTSPQTIELMERTRVLQARELEARFEVKNETYLKKLQIESRVLGDMVMNHIVPTSVKYQNVLLENVRGLRELYGEAGYKEMAASTLDSIREMAASTNSLVSLVREMTQARARANEIPCLVQRAQEYETCVLPFLDRIRHLADNLEMIIDDDAWPLPKYRELMFLR